MSSDPVARRILAATDLSESAAEAIRQAHAEALAEGGLLGVCHVLPTPGVHMLFPQLYAREAVTEPQVSQRVEAAVAESVASVTGRAPGSFEVFIEQGSEHAEIVRRAQAWRATLIVVGSHGRSAPTGLHLGSVAEHVVRYAGCSVLVARRPPANGLVIAATDLSAPSLSAIEAAVVEARRRRAKLHVLHVVDQGVPLSGVGGSMGYTPLVLSPEMLEDIRRMARERIDAFLGKLGAQADIAVVEGRAVRTILQYVAEQHPELLVVGTHGLTGVARVLLGSVAERVVRAATGPVLVARSQAAPLSEPR